jgi:peptidoglycan hydrolase CwlO-like protein
MTHRAQDASNASLQQAAATQYCEYAGVVQPRTEEANRLHTEVERLQQELESVRAQLWEENRRVKRAEEELTSYENAQALSEKQLRYQEYKSEYLRRELEKRGRPRSLNRNTQKYEMIPDKELQGLVGNHEIFRNVYDVQSDDNPEESMTKKEQTKLRQKEREEEEREERELAAQHETREANPSSNVGLRDRL